MKTTAIRCCCLLTGLLAGGPAFAAETTAAPPGWAFSVAPYLWVPTATLDSNVPELPPDDTQRFTRKLSGAFMIAGQVQYNSFGLFADYAWLRLDSESNQPGPGFSAVDLRSSLAHATAALTWRVPTASPWRVELLAGVRIWMVDAEQVFHSGVLPGFTHRNDQTWTDPTFGVDVRYAFDDHWFVTGKFLLGGLGSGSKAMTEALAGVGYQINPGCSVRLGYRYLHEDFARRGFTWDLQAQGFLVGLDFHF